MMILKKIIKEFVTQASRRGLYITLLMNLSHLRGIWRGIYFKLIFFRNIKCSIFSLQSSSKIEIFHKESKVHIGKYVFVRKNASFRIDHAGELNIGDYVFVNDNCNINCVEKISIGKNTKIAPNVCINDHDHNYRNIDNHHLLTGEVVIGENVWIGANVVILRNTHIGNNAVIAAGSVVKGNIPANSLYLNTREEKVIPFNKPKVAHG
jgi:acetyltransferase-like isoleucine patch superfamily enzyme